MARFVVRRLLVMCALLFATTVVTFGLFTLIPSANPAVLIAGRLATPQEIEQINIEYGFNKPIYVQYVKTMKNILTGKAYSYQSGFNVDSEIKAGLPATLSLALGAGLIWFLTSIAVGTLAAVRAGQLTDRLLAVLALTGVSMPVFFLGAVLLYYLGYQLNWFPLGGYTKLTSNPLEWFKHLVLPWFSLSVLFIGFYSRVLRSSILDSVNEDYVRTARAKGLSERQVLVRHILRNSLIPIISLFGLDLAQVIGGGAIITESVFNLHGVGELARDSIQRLDIITLMAIVMLTAAAVVILGAVVDVITAYLDPRIRLMA
jgi:peptide/nickel transport system permease protein